MGSVYDARRGRSRGLVIRWEGQNDGVGRSVGAGSTSASPSAGARRGSGPDGRRPAARCSGACAGRRHRRAPGHRLQSLAGDGGHHPRRADGHRDGDDHGRRDGREGRLHLFAGWRAERLQRLLPRLRGRPLGRLRREPHAALGQCSGLVGSAPRPVRPRQQLADGVRAGTRRGVRRRGRRDRPTPPRSGTREPRR